jgi:hypothetical protein
MHFVLRLTAYTNLTLHHLHAMYHPTRALRVVEVTAPTGNASECSLRSCSICVREFYFKSFLCTM